MLAATDQYDRARRRRLTCARAATDVAPRTRRGHTRCRYTSARSPLPLSRTPAAGTAWRRSATFRAVDRLLASGAAPQLDTMTVDHTTRRDEKKDRGTGGYDVSARAKNSWRGSAANRTRTDGLARRLTGAVGRAYRCWLKAGRGQAVERREPQLRRRESRQRAVHVVVSRLASLP